MNARTTINFEQLPQDFKDRVTRALERLNANGIVLWRPWIEDDELLKYFTVSVVDGSIGCTNEQCNHNSHDPASPSIKLIPKDGSLVYMGEVFHGDLRREYYLLLTEKEAVYLEVVKEPNYYDKVFIVDGEKVPDFLFGLLDVVD